MTRWLETDTYTNKDISAAVSIGVYTADADRLVLCQFFADQVAGNGDYEFYLTQQIGGAGSSYRHVPKTTATVASGVTAIAGQSIHVAVRSGDVLTLYVDGLAGDTATPDTTVRWFEMAALRPATADRQVDVGASGQITTVTNLTNLPAAAALEATLDEMKGVGWTTDSTLVSIWSQTDNILGSIQSLLDSLGAWTGTGVNNVLGAFKALLSKTASAPSDIGGTFAPAADSVEAISEAVAAIGGGAGGSGAISYPITVQDEDSNPIDGVEVWITTDSAGTNVVAGTLSTDALGLATFMLDAGAYYVWRQASGYNFANPVAITVS